MSKKIYWRSFWDGLVKWVPLMLLVFVTFKLLNFIDKNIQHATPVTIKQLVKSKAKEVVNTIVHPKLVICTTFVDTNHYDASKIWYPRPWMISDLEKRGDMLTISTMRPTGVKENDVLTGKQILYAPYKDFSIGATKDSLHPFAANGTRDFFDLSLAVGISTWEKPYVEAGAYLVNINFQKFRGDVGLKTRVSLHRSDLAVEVRKIF